MNDAQMFLAAIRKAGFTVSKNSDHGAVPLTPEDEEPATGSVLMLGSTTGTAVQRFYSDGKYHTVTGEIIDTYNLLFYYKDARPRPVYLVFDTAALNEEN